MKMAQGSENEFKEFLSDLSAQYPGSDVKYLRLLLHDHLTIGQLACKNISGLDLFNELYKQGDISYTNMDILSELAELTKNEKAVYLIDKYKKDIPCQSSKRICKRLLPYRKALFRAVRNLTPEDVQNVDRFYNLNSFGFNNNIWDMIFYLECQGQLNHTNKKWERFAKQLNKVAKTILLAVPGYTDKTASTSSAITGQSAAPCTQPRTSSTASSKIPFQNQDEIIEQRIRTNQTKLFQTEHMTQSSWNDYHKFYVEDIFIELKLHQSESQGKKEELKSFTVSELFNIIKSKTCTNVLITGEGGMGKTTLLKYIANSWATATDPSPGDDYSFYTDKIFFLINMRHIKTETDILDEIMKQICVKFMPLKKESVENFLKVHTKKLVILIDGYDEIERHKRSGNNPINVFTRKLQNSTIVLTSRPVSISHLIDSSNIHIEVMGFGTGSIMKYIRRYFQLLNKSELGESLIKNFRLTELNKYHWGGDHPDAFRLCSSPLLLRQICNIWTEKKKLPKNKSDLFEEVIICTLNQYIKYKIGGDTISEFSQIESHSSLFGAILLLGKFMYKGLKVHNKLYIKQAELNEAVTNEYKYLVPIALELGFVYQNISFEPGKNEKIYMPPHKLISEALAGYYLSNQIKNKNNSSNEFAFLYDLEPNELVEIGSNPDLHMTRELTMGFLGFDGNTFQSWWNFLVYLSSVFFWIVNLINRV